MLASFAATGVQAICDVITQALRVASALQVGTHCHLPDGVAGSPGPLLLYHGNIDPRFTG